jgi:pyruvate/2-oxoglutarate dehydrogenase complex dihydrolipoamide acyltransferase (E2) component
VSDTLVRMPKLADTLVEGTVGKWLKQVGESVAAGEPLVSIETDKVTTEVTSPAAGSVLELLVPEGQTVAIETPIARIGAASPHPNPLPEGEGAPPPLPLGEVDAQRRVRAGPRPTPVATRLLAEHGLTADDLGTAKRVTSADVLRYLEEQNRSNVVPLSRMRRAIAEHMVRARQTIPMGQTVMQADLTDLATRREREKQAFERDSGAPLTYTVLFIHALARALATRQEPVDVGVAVAVEAGLIVPVVRNADRLSLAETARALVDLATRAKSGGLQPGETRGALMTLTNVGSFGNLFASPIVPLEQIGILGPGIVERRPLPTGDGGIRIGWRCWMTLMFDRRVFDDLAADRFLGSVIELLFQLPQHAHRR